FENIAFVLRVLGTPRREITPKAFQALKAVGLSSRAQAYPAQLSQGEAQRAALARAIVKSPALLLADEPTGNLDEEMASEILDLIKDIWSRGTTVLFATHQSRLATQLKRRTLRLGAGVLIKDGGRAGPRSLAPPSGREIALHAELHRQRGLRRPSPGRPRGHQR